MCRHSIMPLPPALPSLPITHYPSSPAARQAYSPDRVVPAIELSPDALDLDAEAVGSDSHRSRAFYEPVELGESYHVSSRRDALCGLAWAGVGGEALCRGLSVAYFVVKLLPSHLLCVEVNCLFWVSSRRYHVFGEDWSADWLAGFGCIFGLRSQAQTTACSLPSSPRWWCMPTSLSPVEVCMRTPTARWCQCSHPPVAALPCSLWVT